MPFTNIWDTTFPPDTQLANQLGVDLRNFRLDTQQRMAAISGLDAAKPAFGADAQPANWNGVLFFATDTGKIYQFNNPSWTDVTADFITGGGGGGGSVQKYYDMSTPSITNPSGLTTVNGVTIPANKIVGGASPNGNVVVIEGLLSCVSAASGNFSMTIGGFSLGGDSVQVGRMKIRAKLVFTSVGGAFSFIGEIVTPAGIVANYGSSTLTLSSPLTVVTQVSVGVMSVTGEGLVITIE